MGWADTKKLFRVCGQHTQGKNVSLEKNLCEEKLGEEKTNRKNTHPTIRMSN